MTAALTWFIELAVLVFLEEVVLKDICKYDYLIAGGIAFTVYLIANYIIGVKWVFHSRAHHSKAYELMTFLVINLFGLIIYEVLLWVFTSQFHIYYVISNIMTNPFVYAWNFFSRKYFLYD